MSDEQWRMSIAVDYRELLERPLEKVAGRDEPAIVLSDQERRDIGMSLMTLEQRVRSLGDARRLCQIMEGNNERDAMGRIVVDMATDMVGLDEATSAIIDELVHRLAEASEPHCQINAGVLRDAQARLRFDPMTRQ